jgi:hypothetical protein
MNKEQSAKEYAKKSECIPTDKEITDYAWQWAEDGKGSGDKFFADCNFRIGAKWMRDKWAAWLEENYTISKKEKMPDIFDYTTSMDEEADRIDPQYYIDIKAWLDRQIILHNINISALPAPDHFKLLMNILD